jgi:hypothetical protein
VSERIDVPATPEQKRLLAQLSPDRVDAEVITFRQGKVTKIVVF